MKNFELQRFSHILRIDFVQGRQQLLWCVLGILMAYLFFFWFAYNIGMKVYEVTDWNLYIKSVCEGVGIFGAIAMYIYLLATASTLYWREQNKLKRTAWLMLPATNMEKFLSRWVYMFAVSLGGFLMFFVADAIHMAWLWMTDKPVIAATTYFLKMFPQTSNSETWLNVLMLYCLLVSIHAFFLFGGVLFRKFQPVITALVGIVLFLVLAHFTSYDQPYMRSIPLAWYYSGMSVIFIALTCVFTVQAYRLYSRWQIATHNFVNLP